MKAAGETSKRRITSQIGANARAKSRDGSSWSMCSIARSKSSVRISTRWNWCGRAEAASQLANPEEMAKDAAAAEEVLAGFAGEFGRWRIR